VVTYTIKCFENVGQDSGEAVLYLGAGVHSGRWKSSACPIRRGPLGGSLMGASEAVVKGCVLNNRIFYKSDIKLTNALFIGVCSWAGV
jgi:hypothetical protein